MPVALDSRHLGKAAGLSTAPTTIGTANVGAALEYGYQLRRKLNPGCCQVLPVQCESPTQPGHRHPRLPVPAGCAPKGSGTAQDGFRQLELGNPRHPPYQAPGRPNHESRRYPYRATPLADLRLGEHRPLNSLIVFRNSKLKPITIGCRGGIRTRDLQLMRLASYQTAPPRDGSAALGLLLRLSHVDKVMPPRIGVSALY